MRGTRREIPPEFISELRSVCLDLPEAYQERARVGALVRAQEEFRARPDD